MKAYEIKVSIKGAKPPIWRKIAVPTDINFMQLHNIIQVSMGWHNYHMYEFSFKEFEERITNDQEACEEYEYYTSEEGKKRLQKIDFDFMMRIQKSLHAKEVKIDKYFKKTKNFKYIYDFGDWWEHTVEVIGMIDDYTYEFPQVLKFRQCCPPEDCGGIDNYYDFLEKYNNKTAPEHDEAVEWANMQSFDTEYDIEAVNEELKDVLDLEDIMGDMF
ncbi:plasmid pRiA4b ORF-3 family protein [Acetivibrio sp. MSJd-27]|uniref:plasmid pRiA4b ORF-3 family protein n=1 Tax=Acetivibrio sp. MSJd-27 TaxID=2841523 RepID=UPI001C0FBBD6|nr:plasmid pRiA4b ORF-3 family protein [Acetivibrio sp. MSJd-27]MBU5451447.1 plasmid pRiA4b ORF-3 family protein [Acetivibrio sp. MSJd-27]